MRSKAPKSSQRQDGRAAKTADRRKYKIQLDLDYLERRGAGAGSVSAVSGEELTEPSPDSLDLVKVVVLGAPAVGKTSIIEQFVWNDFDDRYSPTDRRHTFYPSVVINERIYAVKITDVPSIPYFPVDSYLEWTDYRFYGLRSATAYVLVFDLANVETFQYIRTLREQIYESRDMRNVPLLVVGNKQDLLCNQATSINGAPVGGRPALTSSESTSSADLREKRRNIVNLVRKHWKCGYVECSAKYNWRVVGVFRELMEMVDGAEWAAAGSSAKGTDVTGAGSARAGGEGGGGGGRCSIV